MLITSISPSTTEVYVSIPEITLAPSDKIAPAYTSGQILPPSDNGSRLFSTDNPPPKLVRRGAKSVFSTPESAGLTVGLLLLFFLPCLLYKGLKTYRKRRAKKDKTRPSSYMRGF